jgi:hypothetical protein
MVCSALGWLLPCATCLAAAISTDALRVYRIESDSFDYTFTSYVETARKQPVLSFNHRGGKTSFVKVGDLLDGGFKVVHFEPATEQVFDSTLNVSRKSKAGKVTLQGPGDQQVALEMGKPCLLPGWRALIVSLATADQWSVRSGETFANGTMTVDSVSDRLVTVKTAAQSAIVIPPASDEEKVAVAVLWRKQQEDQRNREEQELAAAQEQSRVASQQREVIQVGAGGGALAAGRVTGVAGSRPRMFIGTEYRYPTEYDVWIVPQGRDGGFRPLIIPKKFETRMVGGAIGPGADFSWTSVSPGYQIPPPRDDFLRIPYPQSRFSRVEFKANPK